MSGPVYTKVRHADGWVSVDPMPSPEFLQSFYAELYYQTPQSASYQTAYDDLELRYRELKSRALLHALAAQGLPRGASFLDVGAGEGFLMDAATRAGYVVTGADFSSYALKKFVPRLESRLLVGDIFATLGRLIAAGERFQCCSALNVLEHVIDPAALCRSLRALVGPDGLIAVTVPNDFSPLQRMLLESGSVDREYWFVPPQHLHYFNAKSLVAFCESAGFDVADAFSDFPIDLYLLHPGSNYVRDPAAGPAAHRGRMVHDLLVAENGLDAYLGLYRGLFRAGIGRDLTVLLRPRVPAS